MSAQLHLRASQERKEGIGDTITGPCFNDGSLFFPKSQPRIAFNGQDFRIKESSNTLHQGSASDDAASNAKRPIIPLDEAAKNLRESLKRAQPQRIEIIQALSDEQLAQLKPPAQRQMRRMWWNKPAPRKNSIAFKPSYKKAKASNPLQPRNVNVEQPLCHGKIQKHSSQKSKPSMKTLRNPHTLKSKVYNPMHRV